MLIVEDACDVEVTSATKSKIAVAAIVPWETCVLVGKLSRLGSRMCTIPIASADVRANAAAVVSTQPA